MRRSRSLIIIRLPSGCALFWFGYSRSGLPLYGDSMVWYNLFIMFSMYCMLPVPVKWCTICCLLTAIIHLILVVTLTSMSTISEANHPSVSRNFSLRVVHKWRHGLRGRGPMILWRQFSGLSCKKRDDVGSGSQKKCPKLRDVIYGRSPSAILFCSFLLFITFTYSVGSNNHLKHPGRIRLGE